MLLSFKGERWVLRSQLGSVREVQGALQRLRYRAQSNDTEGIRAPAGRAQWISTPSPWPLGHSVMQVMRAGSF